MDADLEQIKKPLAVIIKAQIDTPANETEMYFDDIHLSPLKVLANAAEKSAEKGACSLDSRQFLHARQKPKRRTARRISLGRISPANLECCRSAGRYSTVASGRRAPLRF